MAPVRHSEPQWADSNMVDVTATDEWRKGGEGEGVEYKRGCVQHSVTTERGREADGMNAEEMRQMDKESKRAGTDW